MEWIYKSYEIKYACFPYVYILRGNERRAADGSEHQGTKGVLLQAEEWSTEDPWPYVHAIPSQLMISQG